MTSRRSRFFEQLSALERRGADASPTALNEGIFRPQVPGGWSILPKEEQPTILEAKKGGRHPVDKRPKLLERPRRILLIFLHRLSITFGSCVVIGLGGWAVFVVYQLIPDVVGVPIGKSTLRMLLPWIAGWIGILTLVGIVIGTVVSMWKWDPLPDDRF